MTIKVGDTLPEATLTEFIEVEGNGCSIGPNAFKVSDLVKGKKIAMFALPGAFTPTCSARHLPGYVDKAAEFEAKGVSEIVCTSVNDVFVMGAWGKSSHAEDKIRMLADGNGAFAQAIGLELDASGFGMGKRSQRYSMLVKDGVVAELNVEQGGEFKVSGADYLLSQL